jgi:Alternative complex III, ActD subunit
MRQKLYGLLAQFETPERLVEAAREARSEGYRILDAHTPFPVEGLADSLGLPASRLPGVVLAGGITGLLTGYGLQYYASVISYPLNVGGRPPHSWPAFIPITFELTILFAAISAILGMLALNGLPMPHHPLFSVPAFDRASQTRFFLVVEARDPRFDPARTREFLRATGASEVFDVEL